MSEDTTTPPTSPSTKSRRWSCQPKTNTEKEANQTDLTASPQNSTKPADQAVISPPPPTAAPTVKPKASTELPTNPILLPLLLFDFYLADLTATQKTELCQRLARLPAPLAQKVLDEYNSAVGRKVRFRNKWGWFEFLIRAAQEGRFIPTSDLAERRIIQTQTDATPTPAPTALLPQRQPSTVWEQQYTAVEALFTPGEALVNVSPLRGVEDSQTLWLEAPNSFVADWVRAHLPQIETVIRPHTPLPIRVRIG